MIILMMIIDAHHRRQWAEGNISQMLIIAIATIINNIVEMIIKTKKVTSG